MSPGLFSPALFLTQRSEGRNDTKKAQATEKAQKGGSGFRILFIFSAGVSGRGGPRRWEGGGGGRSLIGGRGGGSLIENPRKGGSPGRVGAGGVRGREGVCGECGGGVFFFFSGPRFPPSFSVDLDREWPWCPTIWVGTSRD